jgi:hypothetical protein
VTYVILFIMALVYLSFLLMLVSKIIEAFIRVVGGTGFDRSRSTTDSGLIGACAMAGCCGSRRRRMQRKHRAKQSDVPPTLPISHSIPRFPKDAGSTHSGGPPSVLRPEHALRPYKEDADDESGYIMGAWHRPGYDPLDAGSPLEPPSLNKPSTSGFSRVAGGRANFDSPFAIATGSTHTFPSAERLERSTPVDTHGSSFQSYDESGLPLASLVDSERQYSNLPPGAMPPHLRKKSQTAIVETMAPVASAWQNQQPAPVTFGARRQSFRPEIVSPDTEDDLSDSEDAPRSKKWYIWSSKSRRHSDGDESQRPAGSALEDAPEDTGAGRTFLGVRRKRRASAQPPEMAQQEEASAADGPPKKAFVVIRPPASGRSTPGAGPSISHS